MATNSWTEADLHHQARGMLEVHWDADRGFCVPNADSYPHLWLWDSCFHAIVWAHLGDVRAGRELAAVLDGQLPGGIVAHMQYVGSEHDTRLGPLPTSLTHPPMFGHAVRVLLAHGITPGGQTVARALRGLNWLWTHRRTGQDLLYVVHPWEAGTLAARTREAAVSSGWAEYWDPETGDGLGAVPQSWTGLVVAMIREQT